MRIAIINHTIRRVGGTETYLARIIPALRATHEVMFWCEFDAPSNREPIAADLPVCAVSSAGQTKALAVLRDWEPDVLYVHGLVDPALEARVLDVAPAVFFAHGYYGACITGSKTTTLPVTRPCTRTFGPACLLQFYPRRCGGLNPGTMAVEYRRQADRLRLLPRYAAILTHSEHMRQEFGRYAELAGRVHTSWYTTGVAPVDADTVPGADTVPVGDILRLVFAGRMETLKGGEVLLAALPLAAAALRREVSLTFLGDGPARARWQRRAAELTRRHPTVAVEFRGWQSRSIVSETLATAHALVMPSLWPEPYGLIGIEAARVSVPTVAFAVGGIPEWLKPGINGELAPADPPTSRGLASALVRCVDDDVRYNRLRRGAARMAAERDGPERHLIFLESVLTRAASRESIVS